VGEEREKEKEGEEEKSDRWNYFFLFISLISFHLTTPEKDPPMHTMNLNKPQKPRNPTRAASRIMTFFFKIKTKL